MGKKRQGEKPPERSGSEGMPEDARYPELSGMGKGKRQGEGPPEGMPEDACCPELSGSERMPEDARYPERSGIIRKGPELSGMVRN